MQCMRCLKHHGGDDPLLCDECRTESRSSALDVSRLERLEDFVDRYTLCPCCAERETCLDDCTYQEDCPDDWQLMVDAREAKAD